MSNTNGLDRFALAALSAGAAMSVLSACGAPTTVIGRNEPYASVRAGKAGAKAPLTPVAQQPKLQILVKFKARMETAELTTFRAAYGLRHVSMIGPLGVYVEEVTGGRQVVDVLRELQASPLVEYAELNQEVRIEPATSKVQ